MIETNRPLWVGSVFVGKNAICEILVWSVGASSEVEYMIRIIRTRVSFGKNQQPLKQTW